MLKWVVDFARGRLPIGNLRLVKEFVGSAIEGPIWSKVRYRLPVAPITGLQFVADQDAAAAVFSRIQLHQAPVAIRAARNLQYRQ